jgi:hypothetical protein
MEAGLLVGIASVSDIVREVADLAAPTPAADAIGG